MKSTAGQRGAFLIAIDTEGDDLWSRPTVVTTRNVAFLPRFQALCDRFGFKPTYLTNWEMALDAAFCEFAAEVRKRGGCGIGMHLHAWDNPPIVPLTDNDPFYQPYLIEYDEPIIRAKVERVTARLEDTFGAKMRCHRAGRWGFDARYAQILLDNGFETDCSVTPHVSWAASPGDPSQKGGSDYMDFPDHAYRLDPSDIARPGAGGLLELPMTIMRQEPNVVMRMARRILRKAPARIVWLRPNGRNLADMLWIVDKARVEKRPYIQFTLHSSEFMPGGSPTFTTTASIEALYEHMAILFEVVARSFSGTTIDDYADLLKG